MSEGGLELLSVAEHPHALKRFDLRLRLPQVTPTGTNPRPDTPRCANGGITRSITIGCTPEGDFGGDTLFVVGGPPQKPRNRAERTLTFRLPHTFAGRDRPVPCRVACLLVAGAGFVSVGQGVVDPDTQGSQQG